jgi:hypothetical protein
MHQSRQGTVTNFTMSGTSQATAAFGSQTYRIRVSTSGQPAYVLIGDGTPTASATVGTLIPATWAMEFAVTPGQKLAVLQAGTAGSCSVTELF